MEEQISNSEIEAAFRIFDLNGDGHITKEELGFVMKLLGQVLTENELSETLRQVDGDHNGTIEFREFVDVMKHMASKTNPLGQAEEEIWRAFLAFDKDQNGFISSEELFDVLKSLGEMPSKEEVLDMIRQADVDRDGHLSYLEFRQVMMMES